MPIADPRLIKTPGRYWDDNGLYLEVVRRKEDRLSKNWLMRYTNPAGKRRDMGLGAYPEIGLAVARNLVLDARTKLRAGVDPLDEKRAARTEAKQAADKALSFKAAALEFLEKNEGGWINDKHKQQWRNTLETYAYPTLGKLACSEITPAHVADALAPIWAAKRETAQRVRGRVERVLDFAAVKGARDGNTRNPALWKGNLEHFFPKKAKAQVRHHPALPYKDVPAFMVELAGRTDLSARCLEITILTVLRTSESLGARSIEMDLEDREAAIWTVPARRMKMKREHRVPLSPQAFDLIEKMAKGKREQDYLFPGTRGHLSNMAMLMLLRNMDRTTITVHGFRSSFKDWASECTDVDGSVSEMALAHIVEDKTEAAYRRGDLLAKRAALMRAWADFCLSGLTSTAAEKGEATQRAG